MKKLIFLILIVAISVSESCANKKYNGTVVRFETNYGNIVVRLYPETAKHHDNFVKLVKSGFYNGVLFHRVIGDFMIQAGDPESKTAKPDAMLGSGDVGYTIPAEFVYPKYFHRKGALAAARQGDQTNPQKASSGCQFYIVQGKTFTDSQLDDIDRNNAQKLEGKLFQEIAKNKQDEINKYRTEQNKTKLDALRDSVLAVVHTQMKAKPALKLTPLQREEYKTIGGTPHLDGDYTVFGEVVEGMEVVENISKVKTGANDRPVVDVRVIKAEVMK
ncbi:MAG: peptidylprolyl isomerase [Paludibacter sp.]